MLVQYYYPISLSPARLDRYLAGGWFRNAALLYRSQIICLDEDFFSVINIRLRLADYQFKKRFKKILRKVHQDFDVVVRPATITRQKEELYQKHKVRFEGFIYHSLEQFFYGDFGEQWVYNTYEVSVYDGDKLIAVSFFDMGKKSMASLLGLYDMDYKKYSLGIFTMLQEIQYAQQKGMSYYYPGYVLDTPSVFDYKLELGTMQYYNWNGRWQNWNRLPSENFISKELRAKTQHLIAVMKAYEIPFQKFLYPLFSVGYFEHEYVRSAVYLSCFHDENQHDKLIVEYDIETAEYVVSRVEKHLIDPTTTTVQISEKLLRSDLHFLHLLTYEEVYLRTPSAEKVAQNIKSYYDNQFIKAFPAFLRF